MQWRLAGVVLGAAARPAEGTRREPSLARIQGHAAGRKEAGVDGGDHLGGGRSYGVERDGLQSTTGGAIGGVGQLTAG